VSRWDMRWSPAALTGARARLRIASAAFRPVRTPRLWPIKVTGAMGDVEVIAWRAMIVCAIEAAVGCSEPSSRPRRRWSSDRFGRRTGEVPKERWPCYRCGVAVMLSQINP
jgi:hypothetical protein